MNESQVNVPVVEYSTCMYVPSDLSHLSHINQLHNCTVCAPH